MLLKYDYNLDTMRSTELSILQVIDFPFWVNRRVSPFSTHMNIRVLSKAYEAIESVAFHRAIALLRTDRDHEQKLVLARLLCTAPGRVKSLMGFTFAHSSCAKTPFSFHVFGLRSLRTSGAATLQLKRHTFIHVSSAARTYIFLCLNFYHYHHMRVRPTLPGIMVGM